MTEANQLAAHAYNQQTLEAYDKTVDVYCEKSPQEPGVVLRTWIDDNLAAMPEDARIIEIGSGSGKDADYMESQGFSIERTDASQGFIDFLRSRGHEAAGNGKGSLKTIEGTANFSGTIEQFKQFLTLLETNSRIVDIDTMEVAVAENDALLFKLKIKTYFFAE